MTSLEISSGLTRDAAGSGILLRVWSRRSRDDGCGGVHGRGQPILGGPFAHQTDLHDQPSWNFTINCEELHASQRL